ncbi:MAG: efflux transporter periplasmic adaptor subunit, partial [Candidatus Omnitrophica bacterium]|nr:efflux transporter periplasmic adaptor subunit [Candidatus Omnitrophota bacterium]
DMRSFMVANPIELPAKVRLLGGDLPMEWNAKVVRLSDKIDRQTRTIGMVVGIENPYNQVVPGVQPPLIKGMYCEVEIQGATRPNSFVIPRTALHGDQVYLVDVNGRLVRQEVVVNFFQSDFCAIREGLKVGDKVVITDLSPAIEGMPLEAVEDRELQETLLLEATGRSDLR